MHELELIISGQHAQLLSDELFELGAATITLRDAEDNPIFEPAPETLPLWPDIKLSAIFEEDISLDSILLQLCTLVDPKIIHHAELKLIPEQDWVRETQSLTKPMCFGDKLWIYPSWDEPPADGTVKILLDPGLAFGTGTHPTTALMLRWLALNPPFEKIVLDYGCGSGILAIAAAKLGASKVIVTDIDPQALLATHDNAARNGITELQLETYLPKDLPINLKIDVIVANILAEPLLDLAHIFSSYLKSGGIVVISGILTEQIEMICNIYEKYFTLKDMQLQQEWASIVWEVA